MKKLIYFGIVASIATSCVKKDNEKYPIYKLQPYLSVPDSLREKQRAFVIETVKAASQHMTGGDYEDVDETIEQAEATSYNLFSVTRFGLNIEYRDSRFESIHPENLTPNQAKIVDSLLIIK